MLNTIKEGNHSKWIESNGDNTLRLDYSLNENSIVMDIGGYKGEWSDKIFSKYQCNIYIFEPIKFYYDNLVQKFQNNDKIKIFNFGLSNVNSETIAYNFGDSSSLFKESGTGVNLGVEEKINVKNIIEWIKENNITNIDLIKINIEGEEYNLLEEIIKNDSLNLFNNIQVQFHTFIENCAKRRSLIREKLALTHKETYNFEFIWENWERIENNG